MKEKIIAVQIQNEDMTMAEINGIREAITQWAKGTNYRVLVISKQTKILSEKEYKEIMEKLK